MSGKNAGRVNPVYTAQLGHYRDAQAAFASERSGDPEWLVGLRANAIDRFAEIGFPSTRLEEWKYTNVAPIAKDALVLRDGDAPEIEGAESLSSAIARDPEALRARFARCPASKDRAFALLNDAFLANGWWVSVPTNADVGAPIHLRIDGAAAGEVLHPRVLVDVAPGARATVVIELEGGPGLTNLVADIEVAANASLDLVLLQASEGDARGEAGFQVSTASARVARDGRFRSHTLTTSGTLVRNDLDVLLAEEGADCELRGLFLGSGSRLIDNHSAVDHAVPHCNSRELYKGILGGRSKGIFRGRVLVRPDAQKTDATQSNPNLLLGEGAEIDTKPQLEIYADDVKCSHGATVGQLDEDAVFYLRSRGIGVAEARALMILAFANEILDALPEGVASDAVAKGLQAVLEEATS